MFLFLHFLHSNVSDNKCHKQKWRVPRMKLVARMWVCTLAIARIKLIRLIDFIKTNEKPIKLDNDYTIVVTTNEPVTGFFLIAKNVCSPLDFK